MLLTFRSLYRSFHFEGMKFLMMNVFHILGNLVLEHHSYIDVLAFMSLYLHMMILIYSCFKKTGLTFRCYTSKNLIDFVKNLPCWIYCKIWYLVQTSEWIGWQLNMLFCYVVISKPKGPANNSEFEHSSIPATIRKIFNLSSHFLTHRDAWAGTFEQVFSERTTPRTDCPGG